MNYWFILEDYGNFNQEIFSFFTSIKDIRVKYDILEMNFQVNCRLYWFGQNRRRNKDVQMDLFYADVTHNVPLEEIFSIPLFKKNTLDETDEIKKADRIQKIIAENDEIKKAMVLKYAKNLGGKVYGDKNEVIVCKLRERWGSYDDVINLKENWHKLFDDCEDDFTGITSVEKCILSTY